jgi:alpha-beta hydrolase superfamily lysophospholipase
MGWSVAVANMNQHTSDNGQPVPGLTDMLANGHQLFKDYVLPSAATRLFVVAHSAGGAVMQRLIQDEGLRQRIAALALTDSVHGRGGPGNAGPWWKQNARHWVASTEELATPIGASDCPSFSAGHSSHPWTTYSAQTEIFKWFRQVARQ